MARYDDETPREPLLSGYQRDRLSRFIGGLPSKIGTAGYEMFRDIGVPGTPVNFKNLVGLSRSLLNDSTFDEEMSALRAYDLDHPSLQDLAYTRSEVDPSRYAYGDEQAGAAQDQLLMDMVMGMTGGTGGGGKISRLKPPRRPQLKPGESQAGFKLPTGDVYETGAYHDITKLPEPYSLGEKLEELVSGHIDDTGAFKSKAELEEFLKTGKLAPEAEVVEIPKIRDPNVREALPTESEFDDEFRDMILGRDRMENLPEPVRTPDWEYKNVIKSDPEGIMLLSREKLDRIMNQKFNKDLEGPTTPGTTENSVFEILQMMKKNYPDLYKKFIEFNKTNPMPDDL